MKTKATWNMAGNNLYYFERETTCSLLQWPSFVKIHTKIIFKQESPPAWTQEAYRPPHSKCLLCCSVWGGVPHPRVGVPQPGVDGGGVPPSRVGVPSQVLMVGGTPARSWWWRGTTGTTGTPLPSRPSSGGYPGTPSPSRPGWGSPSGIGYPPPSRPGQGTPPMWYPHHQDLAGVPPRMGYPPCLLRPGWGTPHHQDLAVYPPNHPGMGYPPPHHPDLDSILPPQTWDGVPPPTIQTWMGYPPRPGMGYPPEMLTDRHLWKQYLPSYYVRGR